MDKDIVVVSRVRYRFDTTLKPLPMRDIKALKILSIPLALKRKRGTEVKIEDITKNIPVSSTQDYKTEREKKVRESQLEKKKEKEIEFKSQEDTMQDETSRLEKENNARIDKFPRQLICNVSPTQQEDYLQIAPQDIYMSLRYRAYPTNAH